MIGSNLEKLYKLFPKSMIPKEYLPDDYTGPTVGSVREITGEQPHVTLITF